MRSIRNCEVAVIGGAGFLGSHLTDYLIEDRGCKVLVVDNLCVGRREFIHRDATFEHHDITTSEERLLSLFKGFSASYVFNYAAHPYIPLSFQRPKHVFEANATGALNVINAAQEAGCLGVLQVSSAEIYGEGALGVNYDQEVVSRTGHIDEESPVLPHSTYGAAKAAIDYLVQCRWREAKTPCIALRQFNCVGERETHPYIVPEIISQLDKQGPRNLTYEGRTTLMNTRATVKLGNNSFRDFLYAGDAVRIAVELLERGQFGEVYNLGSETGVKMYDLAKLIGKLMGFERVEVVEDESRKRPWEIWHLQADVSKIKSVLEPWRSKQFTTVPFEEALGRTIKWFEKQGRKWPWEKR